jgi:hypothetical protein
MTFVRIAILLVVCSTTAHAQLTTADKQATLTYIDTLHDKSTGGYRVDTKTESSLRATAGAVRAIKYLGGDPSIKAEALKFMESHRDTVTGAFSEKTGKPDCVITSVALLGIGAFKEHGSFDKSIDYLRANAKSFEEVRIGAAGLEATNTKPKWLDDWIAIANQQLNNDGTAGKGDGRARETASVAAMKLRLGYPLANKAKVIEVIVSGQRSDGGWGKADATASDLETTYRVMRALMLLKEKPKDAKSVHAWLAKHRNADGGYGLEPGKPSSMNAVYYVAAINAFAATR